MEQLQVRATGQGVPVVLVHGTAPPTWGELPAMLSSDHRVVTYVRRTFSLPHAEATTLRDHADDLAAVLDAVGGSALVVGWSIGGVIALDLAQRRADLLRGLVLVEPPLHLKRHPSFRMLRAILGAQVRRKDPPAAARRFLRWALSRADGSTDVGRLDPEALDAAAPAIVAELRAGTGEKEISRRAVAAINVPCAWLVGSESTPEFGRTARRATAELPRVTLEVVDGAGHAIQLDRPDAVAAAVRSLG
jgi:pimeloyl-ACP methyl ester carboxylesterase